MRKKRRQGDEESRKFGSAFEKKIPTRAEKVTGPASRDPNVSTPAVCRLHYYVRRYDRRPCPHTRWTSHPED